MFTAAAAGAAALTSGIVAATKAAIAFSLTPLGALIAILTVIAGLVAAIFFRKRIADWESGLKKAEESLERVRKLLKDTRKEQDKVVGGIELQIRRLKEGDPFIGLRVREADARRRLAAVQKEIAEKKRLEGVEKSIADTAKKQKQALKDRIDSLRLEIGIVTGHESKYVTILNLEERRLTIARDRITLQSQELKQREQAIQMEVREAARRRRERREQLGLDTPAIFRNLQRDLTTEMSRRLIRAQQERMLILLPPGLRDAARNMLGLGAQGGGRVGGINPAELGGVRAAKRAGGVVFGDKAGEQIKYAKKTVDELQNAVLILRNIELQGANTGMGTSGP